MSHLFFLFFLALLISPSAKTFNLVIDPGHGGSDKGANRGSFVEADIVYQIAEKLKNNFQENSEFQTYITRTNENGATLKDRVQIAHDNKADLFLSLHANSSPSSQVSGMEYYFSASKNAPVFLKTKSVENSKLSQNAILQNIQNDLIEFGKTKQSLELSKKIQSLWAQSEFGKKQAQTSKIRRAPFYVIENTKMPSVLVEVGFISNQREARKLITEQYQSELARALTMAILDFKETLQRKE